jgi:3-oxoacyl-[acyl-carrier protein] reductase
MNNDDLYKGRKMMDTFKGKVVMVTGGGSGLGKETALAFAKEGANVIICGRRFAKLEAVERLASADSTGRILPIRADVSIESDVKMLVQATYAKFGQIDLLVNNAAVFEQYDVIHTSLDSWQYQMNNNVTSAFLMMRECLPIMRTQRFGTIINITSGLTKEGAAGFGAYCASKAALEALTYSAEDEEYKHGIAVHVFNPGFMKTELQASGEDPSAVAPYLIRLAKSPNPPHKKVRQVSDFVTY